MQRQMRGNEVEPYVPQISDRALINKKEETILEQGVSGFS